MSSQEQLRFPPPPLSRPLLYFAFLHRLIEDSSKLFSSSYNIRYSLSVRNYCCLDPRVSIGCSRREFSVRDRWFNDVSRWRRMEWKNTGPGLCFVSIVNPRFPIRKSFSSSWIPLTHFPQNHDFNLFKGFSRRACRSFVLRPGRRFDSSFIQREMRRFRIATFENRYTYYSPPISHFG